MINQLFNRTYIIWACALGISYFIINPREALVQRINNMNGDYINCALDENCRNKKAIAENQEYYNILTQLYPDYGRGEEMQGICYLKLKQDDLAIKKFQQASHHNPQLFWVSFELAKAYYRKGEYKEALKYFQVINGQDYNTLLKKSVLSNLRDVPERTKHLFILMLVGFVNDIKLQSYQLTLACLVHQGDINKAKIVIVQALNTQQLGQNKFFILSNSSIDQEAYRKIMLTWADQLAHTKPLTHPWGYVIPPLKEIMYQ